MNCSFDMTNFNTKFRSRSQGQEAYSSVDQVKDNYYAWSCTYTAVYHDCQEINSKSRLDNLSTDTNLGSFYTWIHAVSKST